MKERVLFIASLIGSFSATIILLINHALVLAGVDTTGYTDIINIVGMVLAGLILVAAVIFLNKYNTIQHKQALTQNSIVTTALDGNANLMQTLLPNLANQILLTAEERGKRAITLAEERSKTLLESTELKVNAMMNEMLPTLAEQTMKLVTQQSQDIVDQTTAKANAVMTTMDELIPTYAKRISDSVAQTVRENNAHYHKMLADLNKLMTKLSTNTQKDELNEKSEKSSTL
jgi:vacuolar-type H+-ATPase subunit H